MLKQILILFLFLFSSLTTIATTIKGNHQEYSGRQLKFFQYSDAVTQDKSLLFTLKINADGKFSADIDVKKTTFVFTEFGIYRGMCFWNRTKPSNCCCLHFAKNRLPIAKILTFSR